MRRLLASGWGLRVVLAAYLLLALSFSFIIPLGESADEVSHYSYIAEIRQNGRLPAPEGPAIGEAHQPPLYYVLAAALTSWYPDSIRPVQANPDFSFDGGSAPNLLLHPQAEVFPYSGGAGLWHLLRVVSVLLGLLTVWGTFLLAREFFPERPGVALTAATLLGLLPSFLLISAVVNNDNLIIVLATLTLICWTRILKGARGWKQGVYLGSLLGLAALAKMPGLILWGVSGVGFAVLALPRTGRGAWVRMGTACFAVALLLYSPWLVHNAVAYADPLAWSRFLGVADLRTEPYTWAEAQRYAVGMLTSLGGRYGGASQIRLPDIAYVGLAAVWLVGIVGLGGLARTWRRGRLEGWLRHSLLLCALFVVVQLLAHIRLMTFILGMDQARLVFSGLPVVVILLAFGLHSLGEGRRYAAAAPLVLAFLISLTALWSVKVAYGQDALPPSLSPPVGHVAVSAAFGDGMQLENAWVEPGPLAPGGTLSVVTRWRAIAAPGLEYWLQVQLTGPNGRSDAVAVRDGVPAGGRVTSDRWQQGDVFESRHTLSLPASLPPGGYEVSVGLHSSGTWDWLPSAGQNQVLVGSVDIGGAP